MKNEKANLQEEDIVIEEETCMEDQLKQLFDKATVAKGSYLTSFDRLVLEFLYKEQASVYTEELWMTLKKEGIKISIATVQLCLNRLYRSGLAIRHKPEGEKKYVFYLSIE